MGWRCCCSFRWGLAGRVDQIRNGRSWLNKKFSSLYPPQDYIASLPGNPSALSSKLLVPFIKHLYDTDVLEEEAILAWWDAGALTKRRGKKDSMGAVLVGEVHEKVRKAVEPLIRWLQEAEEEEEDEDEEEDDDSE